MRLSMHTPSLELSTHRIYLKDATANPGCKVPEGKRRDWEGTAISNTIDVYPFAWNMYNV